MTISTHKLASISSSKSKAGIEATSAQAGVSSTMVHTGDGIIAGVTEQFYLLLESGDYLLLESGDKILI